jgi:hypothetical protein
MKDNQRRSLTGKDADMSKRWTQFSYVFYGCSICIAATVPALTFTDASFAQQGRYSVFEAADELSNESEAATQTANDAFTNPAKQPNSGHVGTFAFKDTAEKAPALPTPKLDGAKAVGSYAPKMRDGRDMFSEPPAFVQKFTQADTATTDRKKTGSLTPFASNSLRSPQSSKANEPAKVAAQEPKKIDNSFPKTARRLSDAPPSVSVPDSDGPEVAQTAFQEGDRFGSFNRQPTSGASVNRQFGRPGGAQNKASGLVGQSFAPQTPAASRPTLPVSSSRTPFNQSGRPFQSSQQQPIQAQYPQTNRVASMQNQNPGQGQNRNVRPAQPSGLNPQRSASAKEILSKWIANEKDVQQLAGKTLSLKELLSQPINGSRKTAIDQYWSTFSALANYKIATEHARWLTTIKDSGQQIDMAMLRAARQDAKARVSETSIRLANSQAMMQELLPSMRDKKGNPVAALPTDIPWVGNLKTNYAEYKRRGMVPNKFNGIDKFFPKQRQLIADRAGGVAAAQQAANQAKSAFAGRQTPIGNVLEAARLKAKSQKDFLTSVKAYNRAIADYVLTVRQDINQPTQLASVLIGSKAVRKSVASKQKPKAKSVVDRSLSKVNQSPKMIPVSSQKKLTEQTRESATRSQPKTNAIAKQKFEFGPDAASAKATNFDPAKVKAEAPFGKRQPDPAANYNGNAVGQAPGVRNQVRSANVRGAAIQTQNTGPVQSKTFYNRPNKVAPKAPATGGAMGSQQMGQSTSPFGDQSAANFNNGQPKEFPPQGSSTFNANANKPAAAKSGTGSPFGNSPARTNSKAERVKNSFGGQGESTFKPQGSKPLPGTDGRTGSNGTSFLR